MQRAFAISFCTSSLRTEMESKHCLEKILGPNENGPVKYAGSGVSPSATFTIILITSPVCSESDEFLNLAGLVTRVLNCGVTRAVVAYGCVSERWD